MNGLHEVVRQIIDAQRGMGYEPLLQVTGEKLCSAKVIPYGNGQ
jgi:ABC-type proline/glycine betaine transport system permease subunit